MNLHKPKALHRFSERRLAGREWENAGERTNAEGGCEAHACMHAAHRCMFDTFKGEMGAEWARGKLNSACVRREDSFWRTGDRQVCLKRLRKARNNV